MDMETFGGTGMARPFAGRGRRGGGVSTRLNASHNNLVSQVGVR